MRFSTRVAALLACGLMLTAGSCQTTKRVVEPLPTPPERLVCELAGTRPTIAADYAMNWQFVGLAATVPEAVARAQAEHRKYVEQQHGREKLVATYVLLVEGKLFVCHNNAQWRRDFEAGIGN